MKLVSATFGGMLGFGILAGTAFGQTGFWNFESPHVSPLALTPSGGTLLAVNTADNRLEVFDVTGPGGRPAWVRSIPVGLDPVSVRARTETEIWVVNHVSDSISIVDLPSGRVLKTIATGDEPADVVFAGSPQRAFVSVSQLNQVRVFDPANLAAAPTIISVNAEEPRALAVSPDGSRVYVAIFESGNQSSAIRQQDVSDPSGPYAGVNPPPNAGSTFSPALNPANPPAPPVAQIVRRDPQGRWRDDNGADWTQFVTWNVVDRDVAIIDAASLGVTYAGSLMTSVMGIGVRPDGTVTAVGTEAQNQVRFESNVQSVFIRSRLGSFDPGTPGQRTVADLNPHLDYSVHSVPQAQRDLSIGDPRAIVWHPTNGRGYVAGMGSNNVVVIDSDGARVSQVNVAEGPTGLALSSDGSRLYVLGKFAGAISVIDTGTSTETARVTFFDPTPSTIKAGRPLLYDTHTTSGLGQASCASCHIDGRTDFLAWDLGNPAGDMKAFNEDCRHPTCQNWHPMKGPMVTQSLQGIVGQEPFHWRGDREDVAAFAPAYVGLQGADAEPSAEDMQRLADFIASIKYAPSPNRNIDGTLPASFVTSDGGTGIPSTGRNLFLTLGVLPGGLTCNGCHALPVGTDHTIDNPPLPLAPQPLKVPQLRGLWEKVGWRRNAQNSTKGFGFQHHSEFDTLNALLNAGFTFGPPGPATQQRRRDVEAFLMCFDTETQAGIGQQVTFDGTNNTDAALVARLTTFASVADTGQAGLIAKGALAGQERGWVYTGAGNMQSDRVSQTTTLTALRQSAAAGAEITFTVVPPGTQRRMGIDRDSDGYLDADEAGVCADPANPTSHPGAVTCVDITGDLVVNSQDFFAFLTRFFDGDADFNDSGATNSQDFFDYLNAFFTGCR